MEVHKILGFGFLEGVYEKALLMELAANEIDARNQVSIPVHYKGMSVGEYFADVIVEDKILLELKATHKLDHAHEVQLVHYLNATDIAVGLLINFGKSRLEYRRKEKEVPEF